MSELQQDPRLAPVPPVEEGLRVFELPEMELGQEAPPPPALPEASEGFSPLFQEEVVVDPREEAARQAAQMVAEAHAEAERLREEARQEAYAQGYQSGQEEGRQASQARVEAACDNLGRAMKMLDQSRAGILAVMEPEIIALVQAATDRILLAPGAVDPSLVRRAVHQAVERVADADKIVVSLHPDDLALVREYRPLLLQELGGLPHLELKPDMSLRPGDCQVSTSVSQVDATLATRREQVFALLGEALHQGQPLDMDAALEEALARRPSARTPPAAPPPPEAAAPPAPQPAAPPPEAVPAPAELEDW